MDRAARHPPGRASAQWFVPRRHRRQAAVRDKKRWAEKRWAKVFPKENLLGWFACRAALPLGVVRPIPAKCDRQIACGRAQLSLFYHKCVNLVGIVPCVVLCVYHSRPPLTAPERCLTVPFGTYKVPYIAVLRSYSRGFSAAYKETASVNKPRSEHRERKNDPRARGAAGRVAARKNQHHAGSLGISGSTETRRVGRSYCVSVSARAESKHVSRRPTGLHR